MTTVAVTGGSGADHVDGHDTLLDVGKAREVLGYSPTFSWRELF
jgi:nucleoside-diphosphate-sugar epimerase